MYILIHFRNVYFLHTSLQTLCSSPNLFWRNKRRTKSKNVYGGLSCLKDIRTVWRETVTVRTVEERSGKNCEKARGLCRPGLVCLSGQSGWEASVWSDNDWHVPLPVPLVVLQTTEAQRLSKWPQKFRWMAVGMLLCGCIDILRPTLHYHLKVWGK